MTQAARPEWIEQLLTPCILQRDEVGFGSHQAIPNSFDESTNCIAEFAKHGVQLHPVSAEDDLLEADLEEMNAKGDWRTWCPIPPTPDNAWRLIAVFDTDDGPRAWWIRPVQPTQNCTGCAVQQGYVPVGAVAQIHESADVCRYVFEAWARKYGTWEVLRDDDVALGTTGYTDLTLTVAWHAVQAARRAPVEAVPRFNHAAKRKLELLTGEGATITGYAFQSEGRRGSIDCHGFVAWFPEPASAPQPPAAAPVELPEPVGVMAPWPVDPSRDYIEWANESPARGTALYTEQQVRQLLAAHDIQGQST